jgi:hypothetical protein
LLRARRLREGVTRAAGSAARGLPLSWPPPLECRDRHHARTLP